jgi:pimeloyl-ACP methyl ester carboxylesterase
VIERDIRTPDGRTLHVYDTGESAPELVVVWHHGTPNIGLPPAPLFTDGVRWVGYNRPGYPGSTDAPDRTVGSAAADVAAIADELGLDRFAVMGHSGGSPHALACAALLPDRVLAAVPVAALAPYDAAGLDWFDGMIGSGVATLTAAAQGRAAKEAYEAAHGDEYDPEFTAADQAAFDGDWGWFGSVVRPALADGPGGAITDDLAYTRPWGFDVAAIDVPVLLLHGEDDGIAPVGHARWLAAQIPGAELRTFPGEGHISVLTHAADAVAWLRDHS